MFRKGRPQYDSKGIAVIMTEEDSQGRWQGLVQSTAPLESSLHKNLIEHLNSEVVLNTIASRWQARQWLESSYLFTRLQKNPSYYDLAIGSDASASTMLDALLNKHIGILTGDGIIEAALTDADPDDEESLTSTTAGQIISRYFITVGTYRKFCQMEENSSLSSLLRLLCEAAEFSSVRIRAAEKGVSLSVCKIDSMGSEWLLPWDRCTQTTLRSLTCATVSTK